MVKKILAFGEVMMRFAPRDNKRIHQARSLEFSFTGTGVNVLSGLSKLGNETALVTRLPDNSIGEAAISGIRQLGISSQAVSRGGDYLGMYFLERGFDLRPTKVTYTNRKESSFCTSQLTDYDFDKVFARAEYIHFCGITLAISEQTRELAIAVATEAKKRNVKVIFDCNYRPKLWNYEYDIAKVCYEQMLGLADVVFMTDRDAEFVLQMPTDKTTQQSKLADFLPRIHEKFGVELIAGTIRESASTNLAKLQGFVCYNGEITYAQSYTFSILDRIGGGDGFASGIIHGYVHQFDASKIVEFGTAAGVLAHTTVGDAPISTVSEIIALINGGGTEIER